MNDLLNQLPEEELNKLIPHLSLVSLNTGDRLYEIGDKIKTMYFPITALISVSKLLLNGMSMDTGTVGPEGMIGIRAVTREICNNEIYVSCPGLAYQIECNEVSHKILTSSSMCKLMVLGSIKLLQKISVEMACSHSHSIESRLARWIITRQDIEKSKTIKTTHQFIANSMGVRRESITNASAKLKGLKIFRGLIEIQERALLEAQCCECYFLDKTTHLQQSNLAFYA